MNRTIRQKAQARIREVTRTSGATPRWERCVPPANQDSAPLAGLGDRRSPTATPARSSIRRPISATTWRRSVQAPVVAASAGTVVFAEYLGIYGDAVIVDHLGSASSRSTGT